MKSANSLRKSSLAILFSTSSFVFLQSKQLHLSGLHRTPIWKHSQYFFWQPLFLHLQPEICQAVILDFFVAVFNDPYFFETSSYSFAVFYSKWFFDLEDCCSNSLKGPVLITLALKAWGFLVLIDFLASFIAFRLSGKLWQFLQLHDSSQKRP